MKECFGRMWTASRSSEQLLQSSVSVGGTKGIRAVITPSPSLFYPYSKTHMKEHRVTRVARYSSLPANESHSYEVQLRSERTRVRWDGQRPRKAATDGATTDGQTTFCPGPFSLLTCRVLHQIPMFSDFHAHCHPN